MLEDAERLIGDVATLYWAAAVGLAVALWLALFIYQRRSRQARPIQPGPTVAQPPGDLEPAIVSFLTRGWTPSDDAHEATLIDLAARRYLELHRYGADPTNITIHLRRSGPDPDALAPFEHMVLDRVAETAVDGVVPLAALQDRGGRRWERWRSSFDRAVATEARARGLVVRFNKLRSAVVIATIGVVAAALLVPILGLSYDAGFWIAGGTLALTALVFSQTPDHRATTEGRVLASAWLGYRAYLASAESFRAEDPAAVIIWDRVLAYGTALGLNPGVTEPVNFGQGGSRRIWSSYGGAWREIAVSYPSERGVVPALISLGALISLVIWVPVLLLVVQLALSIEIPWPVTAIVGLLVLWLIGRCLWQLGRALADFGQRVEVAGEVLRVSVARRTRGENPRPATYHLVVDDGAGDTTTAWILSARLAARVEVHPHDLVVLSCRPWSREVMTVTVVERAAPMVRADTAADAPQGVIDFRSKGAFGAFVQSMLDPEASKGA